LTKTSPGNVFPMSGAAERRGGGIKQPQGTKKGGKFAARKWQKAGKETVGLAPGKGMQETGLSTQKRGETSSAPRGYFGPQNHTDEKKRALILKGGAVEKNSLGGFKPQGSASDRKMLGCRRERGPVAKNKLATWANRGGKCSSGQVRNRVVNNKC